MADKIIAFDGIDRAGKSTLARLAAVRFACQYKIVYLHELPPGFAERKKEIDSQTDPFERFRFYWEANKARSEQLKLRTEPVILDRYFLSTLAPHNVLTGQRLEETVDIDLLHTPDLTFLVIADRPTIERRFRKNPPKNIYERDIDILMKTQEEYLRLIRIYGPGIVIDTSGDRWPDQDNLDLIYQKIGFLLGQD